MSVPSAPVDEAGGDGRAAAAARAAADPLGDPTGCAPGRSAGSSSIAPKANSCVFSLPTIDRARPRAGARRHVGVARRARCREDLRRRRRRRARDVDHVLDGDAPGRPSRRSGSRWQEARCTGRASRRRLRRAAAPRARASAGRIRGRGSRGRPRDPSSRRDRRPAAAASPAELDGRGRARLAAHADLRVPVREVRGAVRGVPLDLDKPAPPCPKCGAKKVERLLSQHQHRVAPERRRLGPRRQKLGLSDRPLRRPPARRTGRRRSRTAAGRRPWSGSARAARASPPS